MQPQADQLWQLVYTAFEHGFTGANSVFASKGQANEMQFALMNDIAALKRASSAETERTQELADKIHAGFMTLEVVGLISSETMQRAQAILDQIKES